METNKPVGWQFYQDGKWWHGYDHIKDHRKNTEEAGFPVRDLYAAYPPAEQQPAPDELSDYDRGFRDGKLDQLIDEVVAESELVEALKYLMEIYPASRHLQNTCSAALTTYRKQGGGK